MFYLTGIQHTKSGDIAIPVLGYETVDGYLAKYHHEMDYAMSNADFLGLTILWRIIQMKPESGLIQSMD